MNQFSIQLHKAWSIFTTPIFELGGNQISMFSLFMALVILGFALWISKLTEKLVARALSETHLDEGIKGSIERFSRYFIISVGVLIMLDTMGVSLSSLAAIGTVLMVGIGFGLQNIAQNFISGLIILLERPIKKGDVVIVGGTTGRVTEIGTRSTMIQTRDDVAIIVPNSKFISEEVVNESFSGTKIRLNIEVGVAYGSDTEAVRDCLAKLAVEHEHVLETPAPQVFFEEFGDSSLNFKLCCWVRDLWAKEVISSELRFAIDKQFREQKIQIPFPQRDLHIRSSAIKQL